MMDCNQLQFPQVLYLCTIWRYFASVFSILCRWVLSLHLIYLVTTARKFRLFSADRLLLVTSDSVVDTERTEWWPLSEKGCYTSKNNTTAFFFTFLELVSNWPQKTQILIIEKNPTDMTVCQHPNPTRATAWYGQHILKRLFW